MAIKSETLAASGSEAGIQRAILNEVTLQIRPHCRLVDLIYHIPNGGSRGDARSAAIAGNNMKLLGAKRGVPDLCFPYPNFGFGALYVEVKRPKDGGLDDEQKNFIAALTLANNFIAIVDDWQTGYKLFYDWLFAAPDYFVLQYQQGENRLIFDPKGYMQKSARKQRN